MIESPTKVDQFIRDNLKEHASDIVGFVAAKFNFSRQRAYAYVAREVKKGNVIKIGKTSSTKYFLVGGNYIEFNLKIKPCISEEKAWQKYVRPMLLNVSDNVRGVCKYVFTEIFNNAIDHSAGSIVYTRINITDENIQFTVMDNGIGIFQKIQDALHLDYKREAILHLSKGKFTTDPSRHSGEGIFFSSRICDRFSILSDDLFYTFRHRDWILSNEKREDFGKGTEIEMIVPVNPQKTLKETMDEYSDQEIGFGRTTVAVALSADPNDPHVSRSQAKRLMMGLEKFRHIVLNFKGVESVGQAFVDEVFRVFQNENPNIKIQYFNANEQVESMIKRGAATER